VHTDFTHHEASGLWRRLNVFIYLNEPWEEGWGGHLELWNSNITHKVASYAPLMNRLVIFKTSDHSFHGHPDPLKCPWNVTRKSIALYYYTASVTDEDGLTLKKTDFRARPGEQLNVDG
jgi:Rps23 Pro-64 3,4-dihydroxylase Tpa1-like proline 4-hydroxylase